ncbi:MAG: tRNA uridine-5-carboxymethylaminomethyl(34) synthesis GTPase MnmE [Kofleriaceae bacterium]
MADTLAADDTIAAIASATGAGGVGVIRVSGPRAIEVVAATLGRQTLPEREVVVGRARDAGGARIDQVIAFAMRAPRSFTGEDVAELHGHGGAANLAALLDAVLSRGARLAAPGEFTRRAFTSGKLDLTQVEALPLVIEAGSERALRVAQAQLDGALGAHLAELHGRALAVLAELEATIDFPEEELGPSGPAWIAAELTALATACEQLARSFRAGRALGGGLVVALVGPVNAGKSSLVNALLGQERVLVAATPGTTRDVVEARAIWDGVPVTLVDTAGERADPAGLDDVERRGIALGRERATAADVVVVVNDDEAGWDDGARFGDRAVVVHSKADLRSTRVGALPTSATTGVGLDQLRAEVLRRAGLADAEGAVDQVLVTARQHELVGRAAAAALAALAGLAAARPAELVAIDARDVVTALAALLGREVDEALLDTIFARFCLGK